MTIDSAERLRDWGERLEKALGIPLVAGQGGGLLLTTKGGNAFGVAPVPGQPALVFTGVIGMADAAMQPSTLRALLALNFSTSLSGMCFVGIEPKTQEILLRLAWTPLPSSWTEQAFAAVVAAFAEHVDSLADSVSNGDIERLLNISPPAAASSCPLSGFDTLA